MTARSDPIRTLRIVAALTIIIYSYDILLAIVYLVYPTSMGMGIDAYYTGELAAGDAGAAMRIYMTVTIVISIAISLLEVRGGLAGLRGHAAKGEARMCFVVGVICALTIVLVAIQEKGFSPEMIEYFISGAVAFLLWHCIRRVLKFRQKTQDQTATPSDATPGSDVAVQKRSKSGATYEDYAAGLKVVGAILIFFSVLCIVQCVVGLFNPGLLGISPATLESGSTEVAQTTVTITLIANIAISVLQLYAGYLAFRERPTGKASVACLILFVFTSAGVISGIVVSQSISLNDFVQVSCAGILLLYWIYYRKRKDSAA